MKTLLAKLSGLRQLTAGASLAGYGILLATIAMALMMVIAFWKTAQY